MKSVSNIILGLFLALASQTIAQSTSEKLKKEQQQLEKNIANTKQLLEKTKSNAESSFNELKLLNNQIAYREQLVRNFDNQIRGAELKIKEKQHQIEQLSEEMKTLREQYKKLLVYAYKHRNKYGKMMYIFSSESYYEAIKRAKYLEKIQELIKKQFLVIEQHQKLITTEMENIEKERQYKAKMLEEKKAEREQIQIDQQKQQQIYQELKVQETQIVAQLKEEERKRANLKAQIDAAIKKEIAEAAFNNLIANADDNFNAKNYQKAAEMYQQALAMKPGHQHAKKQLAEAKRKAESAKPNTPATSTTPSTPATKPVELPETKENLALSKSFEGNRGKLPWPVEKGSITEGYGKNRHPSGLETYNNGVDISTAKNAQVRAVFEGEVTSIMNIPGAGKVVIIKHGNYRTVYSNLQNTFVNVGSKITTKQVIGSLVSSEGQSLSTSHFEIHQVTGSNVTSLNPSLWLAK